MNPRIISTNRADHAMAEPLRQAGLERLDLPVQVTVVLGDRVEMLHAATDAVQRGDKLVHVAGGETMRPSRQFPDHMFRNAISQLADLHCVANATASLNLGDIGISRNHIRVTGLPSLDRLVTAAHALPAPLPPRSTRLFVAYHAYPHLPLDYTLREALAMLDGVAACKQPVLVSQPNSDEHGLYLLDLFTQYCKRPGWTLLPAGYNERTMLEIYSTFACAIGNSSALRIEASAFGLPVVEIGMRQGGRVLPSNVASLFTVESAWLVTEEIFRQANRAQFPLHSPWAHPEGKAAEAIVAAVAEEFGHAVQP